MIRGLALILIGLCAPVLRADFIPISQPTPAYLQATALANFTDADQTLVGALFQGEETLVYNNLLEERTVPGSWGVWGAPPATESATPRVGYTNGASDLTIFLGVPVWTFGLEVEPDNPAAEPMTAAFYSGSTLMGTISLTPNGNAGALLFAASTTTNPFTRVMINNLAGDDFAIAEQRFTVANPEPASLGLATLAMGVGALAFRRRKNVRNY